MVVLPVVVVLVFLPSYVRSYRVHGSSDAPSYLWDDLILVNKAAYDARLKQLMIERGMSVAEIERVLRAGDRSSAVRRFQAGCCTGEAHPERDGV